jgi:hypothetical protein
LGATAGIIFFEIYFQSTEMNLPALVEYNDSLGRSFVPGRNYLVLEEGVAIGEINNKGYLGKDYEVIKKENTVRIGIFGDSYAESMQVFPNNTYYNILEKEINTNSNKNVEVLNFGMSGKDFRTIMIIYELMSRKYNIDYSLIFISAVDFIQTDKNITPNYSVINDSKTFRYNIKK